MSESGLTEHATAAELVEFLDVFRRDRELLYQCMGAPRWQRLFPALVAVAAELEIADIAESLMHSRGVSASAAFDAASEFYLERKARLAGAAKV